MGRSSKMEAVAQEMMALLPGNTSAHGWYSLKAVTTTPEGKKKGKALTKHEPYTLQHWVDHLEGKIGLGIIPITNDSKVSWGAIDIDRYDLNYHEILEKIGGAPLLPVRTKSGGLHVYVFMTEPVAAGAVRKKLTEVARVIGFGGAEVFPKQVKILSERGDLGQWLNMPYFDAESTQRYGLRPDASQMPLEEFVREAKARRVTLEALHEIKVRSGSKDDTDVVDGPPCLQHLAQYGFPHGSRNNGLFALGVYYRKSSPDDWEKRVEDANLRWMTPGTSQEVQAIIKSLRRKDYGYKCDEAPLCGHCDRDACLERKYGVGSVIETAMPVIANLTKILTKPPVYFVDINGRRVGPLVSEDLLQQPRFQKVCFEHLGIATPSLKPHRWRTLLNELHEDVVEVDVPDDSSAEGQLMEHLFAFLTGRARSEVREELLLGRVYYDGNRYHFRMKDFIDYLSRQRFTRFEGHQITGILRRTESDTEGRVKMEPKPVKVKGTTIHTWVATGVETIGSVSIPKLDEEPY